MRKKLILGIDFNNILFGSYYGEKLINSKGMNVNAIKGFFFKLKYMKDTLHPDEIVLANDLSRERTFRRKLYKPYKAQRKQHDDDILIQMKYTSSLCALLGYPFFNQEEYEADDILGMISQFTTEHDINFVIASSDRDLYQLMNDHTFIFSPKTREIFDTIWLERNYKMTPDQWIELKMLQGDVSDNIPGIPGIGEITALRLMQQFGSIDGIYKHLGSVKPRIKELLINGQSTLELSRKLVTIVKDYTKIDLKEEQLTRKEVYRSELYKLIQELEMPSLYNIMEYSLLINDYPEERSA